MFMHDMKAKEAKLENTLVVNEFSDVFPIDLPRLTLEREIKFCIDLVLGT